MRALGKGSGGKSDKNTLAEGERFELSVEVDPLRRFSKPLVSAAHPPELPLFPEVVTKLVALAFEILHQIYERILRVSSLHLPYVTAITLSKTLSPKQQPISLAPDFQN